MRKTIVILSIVSLLLAGISCSGSKSNSGSADSSRIATEVYYTCSMHPKVHSEKPGNCPTCGMELIQKEGPKSDTTKTVQKVDSVKMK
jgi:membrane fusion protein, copper/silver efflux system